MRLPLADKLTSIILKSSRKKVGTEQAQEAANRINDLIERTYKTSYDIDAPTDTTFINRAEDFTTANTKALLEEKHGPIPPHLQGSVGGEEWSLARGYTRDEIDTFEESGRRANEMG